MPKSPPSPATGTANPMTIEQTRSGAAQASPSMLKVREPRLVMSHQLGYDTVIVGP